METMTTTYRDLFKLYDLIQCGDVRSVQRFISECPVDVNTVLPGKGIGVLHLAVGMEPIEKSRECTELMLKYGADPNLCTDDFITPVHIAAIWGRVDNLKLLIGCGGDPSIIDQDGHSAFDYAAREEQWDVYDYLRNVVDQNDSFGSECAYSLNLDKILVTTDQVVAEYEPIPDSDVANATSRKSEMVRDWCDKTTLIMNKLYPTILSETYALEDESAPWKSTDLGSMYQTVNLTLDETKTSYKTCFSRKVSPDEVKISGVNCIEDSVVTLDTTSSEETKRRFTVYENFSLPGSPTNITHKNYNTKTSLKQSRNKTKSLTSEMQEKLTLDDSNSQSFLTDDNSMELNFDRVNIMLQNKTNEWLSSTKKSELSEFLRGSNTRRSSASSGVSSNLSAGTIAVGSVQEEYRYQDLEEGVTLIERRLLVANVVLPIEEPLDDSLDQTIISIASSLPSSVSYDNNQLRDELIKLGFRPGPVNNSTRTLYLKKLNALKKNPIQVDVAAVGGVQVGSAARKTYSIELEKSLRTNTWMQDLAPYIDLENKARADFAAPNKKWREGHSKTSFTYLLLDPRLTQNLPAKAGKQTPHEAWVTFVNSIFYVGKGKRSRPYAHLYQALTPWKRDFKTSPDKKIQHILDIWSNKVGVVCLHVFQNVIPAEAYTNEAAMIDVLGVSNLKNLKGGNYYGITASWPLKDRRMLGLYLLYKAMLIFLSEGERQLRPDDID